MVRKLKDLIIDLIVNIVLDYVRKTVHNPFTTNIHGGGGGFCKTNPLKLLNIPKSNFFSKVNHFKSFLVKMQVLKMDSFTRIFQGFCYSGPQLSAIDRFDSNL